MPIAYYARRADRSYWTDHWARQELDHLLAVAENDPVSRHIVKALPTSGILLEAGCGLGQYVTYLSDRGYTILGGDYSLGALRAHRTSASESPLAALVLRRLPFASAVLQGIISLGVVEHVEEGPQGILSEFCRTLATGGTLLLGVPWINRYRQLSTPRIRGDQAKLRVAGIPFYQYAFSCSEIRDFLGEAAFEVQAFQPYSPARGAREAPLLREMYRRMIPRPAAARPDRRIYSTPQEKSVSGIRRALYCPVVLKHFAHMILVVALKTND